MKRLLVVIVMIVFTLSLTPPHPSAPEAVSLNRIEVVETAYHDAFFMPTFRLSDIQLDLAYEDGLVERIALCYSMLSHEDQEKLNQSGLHELTIFYDAFEIPFQIHLYSEEEWMKSIFITWIKSQNETLFQVDEMGVYLNLLDDENPDYLWRFENLQGPPGTPAPPPQFIFNEDTLLWWDGTEWEVLITLNDLLESWRLSPHLRMEESNLQWLNEDHWETLFSLKDLQGSQGVTGSAGHSPVLRLEDDLLQWYDGIEWHNLFDVNSLAGAPGDQGPQGVSGSAGHSPVLRLEDDSVQWYDGKMWHNLFDVNALAGAPGDQGPQGVTGSAGHSPVLRLEDDSVQWYDGTQWHDLFDFRILTQPSPSTISLRFVDDANNLIEQRWYDSNDPIEPPKAPLKEGKTFSHWQGLNEVITQASVITAVYDTQYHEVHYYDENQEYLKTVLVTSGAWLPSVDYVVSEGYGFLGWSINQKGLGPVLITPLKVLHDLSVFASVIPKDYRLDFQIIENAFHPQGLLLYPSELIETMALGIAHGLFLTTHQRILIWGNHELNPLFGTPTERPQDITALFDFGTDEVLNLFSESHHSAILTQRGALWLWGQNTAGETLHASDDDASIPHRVDSLLAPNEDEIIIDVALAPQRTAVLTNQGRLLVWGHNSEGVLGTGDTLSYTSPQDITPMLESATDKIISILSGADHQGFLTQEGQLYLFGSNRYGQVFPGLARSLMTPVAINELLDLNVNETIVDFAFGSRHTGVLTSQGRLLTWGFNTQGQLGMGTTERTSEVVDLTDHFLQPLKTLTFSHTLSSVQDDSGKVYAWGTLGSMSPFEPPLWQALSPEILDHTIERIIMGPNHISFLHAGWVYSMGSNRPLHGFAEDTISDFQRSHVYQSVSVYQTFHAYEENMTRFDLLYPSYTWYKGEDLEVMWQGGVMPADDVVIYGINYDE